MTWTSRKKRAVRKVVNLSTEEERVYSGLTPSEAVIAAHADSIGDHNTWNYNEENYPVKYGDKSWACGDWCCLYEGLFATERRSGMNKKTIELMSDVYKHVDTLPKGLERDLVDFAGECLESSLFEHDSDFEHTVRKLLKEVMESRKLEAEDEKTENSKGNG